MLSQFFRGRAPRAAEPVARLALLVPAAALLAACRAGGAPTPAAAPAPAESATPDLAAQPAGDARAVFDTAHAIIGRTYWDSTFGGRDWNAIGDSLRVKAEAASTRGELRQVLTDLVNSFGESHFAIIPQEASPAEDAGAPAGGPANGDIGVTVRWIDEAAVVTHVDAGGAAAARGIEPGWTVEAVGPAQLVTIADRLPDDMGKRRRAFQLAMVARRLLAGAPGDTVRVTMRDRANALRTLAIARTPVRGQPVKFGNLPPTPAFLDWERRTVDGRTVGVIRFNVWMIPIKRAFDLAMDSLRDADAIVLDLRGNLGGVGGLSMGIAGHFVDSAVPVGVMQTRAQELKFTINPQRVNTASQRVTPFAGPLAVLTDEVSASTSEIFAAGLQDLRRARIVGRTTPGMALPAIAEALPNGDILYHAIANFVSPNGARIEGPGVRPDHIVALTRADFVAGRDPVLDAALRWAASAAGGTETMDDAGAGGR